MSPLRAGVPLSSKSASTCPALSGYAPVPRLEWIAGVIEGDEPAVAFSYQTPFGISECRTGHSFYHVSRTSRPPAS